MNKLLVILPSLEVGGAEWLATAQLNWLHTQGYPVFLAVLSGKAAPTVREQLLIPEAHLLLLNTAYNTVSPGALKAAFLNRSRIIAFCRQQGITHLLAHLPLSHIWGRLVKQKISYLQLICYHHSLQYTANPLNDLSKKLFHQLNYQWSKRFDDAHIFISEAVQKDICANLPIKKGYIVYNAVPDSRGTLHRSLASKSVHSGTAINLMLPGRLHPAKGHLFFLNVFAALVSDCSQNLHLTIAGGGALQPAIEAKITALGLQRNCILTGPLTNQQLLQAMSGSDLIIIPSVVEGLGIVAIEALMLGKTVVASNAGGLKEVIIPGVNGYLFEAENYLDCLDKLKEIIQGLPGSLMPETVLRKDYVKRFSFDAHMAQLLSILQLNSGTSYE